MGHLYIATPVYDQSVSVGYCQSIAMTIAACSRAGILVSGPDFRGGPYIDVNRNHLAHKFLGSEADTMLFVDADLTWDENAVVSLYQSGLEFCGGAYPLKQPNEAYPIALTGEKNGRYLGAQYLPGGFQMIRKSVFERIKPDVVSFTDNQVFVGETMHVFYQNLYGTQGFCGEDVTVCVYWRRAGGKIWCDPDIYFGHQGPKEWKGNYARQLARGKDDRVEIVRLSKVA